MPELHEILGAGPSDGTVQVTLFVPSVDRDGAEIDQEHWHEEALSMMGRLFRGATAFPPGRGVWRDDARGGALVFDDTVLVASYVSEEIFTERALQTFGPSFIALVAKRSRARSASSSPEATTASPTSTDPS